MNLLKRIAAIFFHVNVGRNDFDGCIQLSSQSHGEKSDKNDLMSTREQNNQHVTRRIKLEIIRQR